MRLQLDGQSRPPWTQASAAEAVDYGGDRFECFFIVGAVVEVSGRNRAGDRKGMRADRFPARP